MRNPFTPFRFLPWIIACTLSACAPQAPDADPPPDTASRPSAEVITLATQRTFCPTASTDVKYNHELVIHDAMTLSDPCRTTGKGCTVPGNDVKWNFMYLMRQAAGGDRLSEKDVSAFTLNWLYSYVDTPTVNGQTLESRPGMLSMVINPWRTRSGCTTNRLVPCELKAEYAPLRLLAVVNRMDTRKGSTVYYGDGLAGEGRLVFGFVDDAGTPVQATVILEYDLPAVDSKDVMEWALLWHSLKPLDPMMSSFGDRLQEITDGFTKNGVKTRSRVNGGSALMRLRSGEFAFVSPTAKVKYHEFREFQLRCPSGDVLCEARGQGAQLLPVPTAQTPQIKYQSEMTFRNQLTAFLNANEPDVLAEKHMVPTSYLAGAAQIEPGAGAFFWYPTPSNRTVRRLFALSTCSGCHFTETQSVLDATPAGFMISPINGNLSRFLNGPIAVNDPLEGIVSYDEKLRRQCEFQHLLKGNVEKTLTTAAGRSH